MSSIYGTLLQISIFGQSHGPAVGVVLDGLPAGLPLDLERLQAFLDRRAPGRSPWTSSRREPDRLEVLSGLLAGRTCGAPLAILLQNVDVRRTDYETGAALPRPGHADYPASVKYMGFQDPAGGGHFSGRLTAPLCAAGGACLQFLEQAGIRVGAHLLSVGAVEDQAFDPLDPSLDGLRDRDFPTLSPQAASAMQQAILQARRQGDSLGGVIECAAAGLPVGLGEPLFGGLENRIAQAVFAIPGVKGLEFGSGFEGARSLGSRNNDAYSMAGDTVKTRSNRAGGILGGLSTGMPLVLRAAVKPTASIALPQQTVDLAAGRSACLELRGRHDPCIAPRAAPCVEAAVGLALYDAYLERRARGGDPMRD